MPEWDFLLGGDGLTGSPGSVHTSPDTDSVSNIVGSVSERSSASSDDLDERVEIFDFVLVFLGVEVDLVHTATFWSTEDTDLSAMDIIVESVEEGNDNIGWETDAESAEVVKFIDGTGTHWVVVDKTHSPSEGTLVSAELSVVLQFGALEEELVLSLWVLTGNGVFHFGESAGGW